MTMYDDLPAPEEGLIFTRFPTIRDGAASWRFHADILGGKIVLEENPASSRPPTALEHTLRPMFSYLHTIVAPRRGSAPPPTTSAPSKACPAVKGPRTKEVPVIPTRRSHRHSGQEETPRAH